MVLFGPDKLLTLVVDFEGSNFLRSVDQQTLEVNFYQIWLLLFLEFGQFLLDSSSNLTSLQLYFEIYCPNVSTTTITAMGCRQCFPFTVVQLKDKHCRKTPSVMGLLIRLGTRVFSNTFILCKNFHYFFTSVLKGQIISKRFFLAEDSSKKRTKTHRILFSKLTDL